MIETGGTHALRGSPSTEDLRPKRRTVWTFALAAVVILFSMTAMGAYIVHQFRGTQFLNAAEAGEIYIEGILAPHALQLDESGKLPEESRDLIRKTLSLGHISGRFHVLTIWGADSRIIYSTEAQAFFDEHSPEELKHAIAGRTVVSLDDDRHAPHDPGGAAMRLLEIYAPIISPASGQPIAVGEIYLDARSFLEHRATVERSMWLAIALTTAGLLSLLSIVLRQRLRLLQNLADARSTADQNRMLREAADSARRAASGKGEQILNEVGAELHDGPIQMLGYLMLLEDDRTDGAAAARAERKAIAQSILAQLRAISSGLILPEIKGLTVAETLQLAVARHAGATGTSVAVDFGNLPETLDYPLRICLFRLVQEGLRNAWRHAGGNGQKVRAEMHDNWIEITVSDEGGGPAATSPEAGLGLTGLHNRLEIFGGTLELIQDEALGTRLVGRVPLGTGG